MINVDSYIARRTGISDFFRIFVMSIRGADDAAEGR